MPSTLDSTGWTQALEALGTALGPVGDPVRLCLVGSAACLFDAMPGRASRDLDIWQPSSDFDRGELRAAAVAAGLAFDPKEGIEPDSPYLQILNPGISQLGEFEPVFWGRFGKLHIYLPPPQNLIASKLVRGERRDVEDILFLATKHRVQASAVRDCVEAFPEPARTQALENCVYLDLLSP